MVTRTWHSYRKREARPATWWDLVDHDDHVFWTRHVYDRWPLIVQLPDRITVKSYRHVPPISDLTEDPHRRQWHRHHRRREGDPVWCNKAAEASLANGRGRVRGARRSLGAASCVRIHPTLRRTTICGRSS